MPWKRATNCAIAPQPPKRPVKLYPRRATRCGAPLVTFQGRRLDAVEADPGAVTPEPLERVQLPLVAVLHVDHHIAVVEQHPAVLAPAFAPQRLGGMTQEPLLDGVDYRADLALVGGRDDEEDVGDAELLGHVEGDQIAALLRGRGFSREPGEGDRLVGCWHETPSVRGRDRVWRCTARCRPARGTRSEVLR